MAADIQAALVAYLGSKAQVTALLGSGKDFRFYPEFLPATTRTRPAATYTLRDDARLQTVNGKAKFGTARVQIDVWGEGLEEGHRQANAVYLALWGTKASPCLDGYRGPMGTGDGRVFVQRVQCSDGSKNSPEQTLAGKAKPAATCSLLVTLLFNDN